MTLSVAISVWREAIVTPLAVLLPLSATTSDRRIAICCIVVIAAPVAVAGAVAVAVRAVAGLNLSPVSHETFVFVLCMFSYLDYVCKM